MKPAKTVLVTGIGGNVGQGILRNVRSLSHPIRLVGTNTTAISAGNHLCDAAHEVPLAETAEYVPRMIEICANEKVDLIIPATDPEAYVLAANRSGLPAVAASPASTAAVFYDKYLNYLRFREQGIPFASSCLPADYRSEYSETIVKPRRGRGSIGIHINAADPRAFDSNEYVVQQRYSGVEITTAFYVDRNGALIGHITFNRQLAGGMTMACVVTHDYDDRVQRLLAQIVSANAIAGSCNVQSIVTASGDVVPFEINGRISGTNSIRSQFGFEDVRYTVEEYLWGITPSPPVIRSGGALRIVLDIIYPDILSLGETTDTRLKHYIF